MAPPGRRIAALRQREPSLAGSTCWRKSFWSCLRLVSEQKRPYQRKFTDVGSRNNKMLGDVKGFHPPSLCVFMRSNFRGCELGLTGWGFDFRSTACHSGDDKQAVGVSTHLSDVLRHPECRKDRRSDPSRSRLRERLSALHHREPMSDTS